MCICDEDGMCYTKDKGSVDIGLVPYCTYNECHIYVALLYGTVLKNERGEKITGPNSHVVEMTPDSKYIKATLAGCNGCDVLKTHKPSSCSKKAEPCTIPPNMAGMIITSATYNSEPDNTIPDQDLCVMDEDYNYYTQYGYNIYMEFVPYCEDTECHMYGIMYVNYTSETKRYPLTNYETYEFLSYGESDYYAPLGKNSPHLKVKAVSSYGCNEIYMEDQCYGPPLIVHESTTTKSPCPIIITSLTTTTISSFLITTQNYPTITMDTNAITPKISNISDSLWSVFRDWCGQIYASGITPQSKQSCIDSILTSSTQVGLIVDRDALNSFPEITSIPLSALQCKNENVNSSTSSTSTQFTRYFYPPTIEQYPSKVDAKRGSAYTLDSDFSCPNFCACTELGACYNQSSMDTHVYVKFVPYCMELYQYNDYMKSLPQYSFQSPCSMYMVVYDQGLYGTSLLDASTGKSYDSPDPNKVAIGINSYYIRVNSISCSGCEPMKNVKCYENANKCDNMENAAGLTIATGTTSASLLHVTDPSGQCHCNNGMRYFWPSTSIDIPSRVFDARKNSFIVNTYHKQTCPKLCICDPNQLCYVPSQEFAYVEFVAYCEETGCHMYAIPYDDSLYGPLMFTNGSKFRSFGRPEFPINIFSPYIIADSISCNGCEEIFPSGKCYGFSETKNTTSATKIFPPKDESIGFDQMSRDDAYTNILSACKYTYDQYIYEDNIWLINIIQCTHNAAQKYHISISSYQKFYMFYMGKDPIFLSNFVIVSLICIGGIILSLSNFLKLRFKITFLTSYNLYNNMIAFSDLVLFLNCILLEGFHNIMHICGNWTYGRFGVSLTFVRTTFHIQQCAITLSTCFYFLQTLERFVAIYFPEQHKRKLNNRKLFHYLIVIIAIITIAQFLIYIVTRETCQISLFSSGQYVFENQCAKLRDTILHLLDIALFVVSVFLNIGTYYKLYKMSYRNSFGTKDFTNEQIILEKRYVVQNSIKICLSLVFILQYLFITLPCDQNQLSCMNTSSLVAWVILLCSSSAYRCLWRFLDEILIFFVLSNTLNKFIETIIRPNRINLTKAKKISTKSSIKSENTPISKKISIKDNKIEQELALQDRELILRARFEQLKTNERHPIPRSASVGSNISMPINVPKDNRSSIPAIVITSAEVVL